MTIIIQFGAQRRKRGKGVNLSHCIDLLLTDTTVPIENRVAFAEAAGLRVEHVCNGTKILFWDTRKDRIVVVTK